MDVQNPFSGITETQSPFDNIGSEPGTPVMSPEQIDHTARLAALATTDPTSSSIIRDYQSATKNYQTSIAKYGDQSIRDQVASKQVLDQTNAFADIVKNAPAFDPSGELGRGATLAAQKVIAEGTADRANYALEQEAVRNAEQLAASGDTTQAQLLFDNMERGGARDTLTEINTKQLILQRELSKANIDTQNQSWFADATDFLLGFLPLYTSTGQIGNVDVPGAAKSWYDGLFSGTRKYNEASALWSMPLSQFSKFVPQLIQNIKSNSTWMGYVNNSERLNLLSEMDKTADPNVQNIYNVLDNVGLIGLAKPLSKAIQAPMMLVKLGARREAAQAVAQAAREVLTEGTANAGRTVGVSSEALAANMLPKAVNPVTSGLPEVSLAGDVSDVLDRGDTILDQLPKYLAPNRLNPEEQQTAISSFIDKVTSNISNVIKDVQVLPKRLSTGSEINQVSVTIGKAKGGGFVSEKTATKYADSLNYKGNVIRDESGQYFVNLNLTVPETGFYTEPVKPRTWSIGLFNKIQSAKNLGDTWLADMAQMSGNTQNKILKTVVEPLVSKFHALNNTERSALQQVLASANTNEHWYNTDEFSALYQRAFKRSPSVKEYEAYQTYIDTNDLEYTLRNDDLWKTKALNGYKSVTFNNKLGSLNKGNAFVDDTLGKVPELRTFDASTGVHYSENNPLTPEILSKLKADGYSLITTEEPVKLADGTTIKSFLVKNKDLIVEDLKRQQLGYREGGHRIYTGKYFVKQASHGVQVDTGRKFLQNPGTYVATETKTQADFWAQNMERARLIAKDGKGDVRAKIEKETRLGSHAGLPTAEDFLKGLDDGTYSKDNPFESLYDREMPSAYRVTDPNVLDYSVPRESGSDGFLRTQGRMYYGKRGEQLKDFNGELAKTLDPYKTINRSLLNVAKLSSFSDYKTAAVKRWVNTFKTELDKYDPEMSDFRQFDRAQFRSDTPERIKQAAETQRQIIQRNLGWNTDAGLQKQQVTRRLNDWIAGTDPEVSWRQSLSSKASDWFESKSPINAMRGFAFDAHLGFFNPAQLFLQAGTAMTTLSMNAGDGAFHALYASRPLRLYLMKAGSEDMLSSFVDKNIWKLSGFDTPKEFKEYMRSAKVSGFFDFGDTHQLINSYGVDTALSDFQNGIDKVRHAGRFFFNEGEVWNRLMAYRFAWRDAKRMMPNATPTSPEFLTKVAGRAEDWAFQMSNQSQAAWQKGLASIPTQFWAYNARMMELFLGKTFTPAQRVKLLMSQLFLTGAAGTPVTYELTHQYQNQTGDTKVTDLNTWQGMMNRGAVDSIMYHLTSVDSTVGERIGTGNFVPEMIRGLFGLSSYGEKSTAEVLGGPTLATVAGIGQTLHDVLRYSLAESGGDTGTPITRDSVLALAGNITTLSNINKARLIWQYGILQSNKGTILADNVPDSDGFSQALGFAPGRGLAAQSQSGYIQTQKDQINDLSKQIVSLRQKAFLEPDRVDDYIQQINLLMKMYPSYIRGQALAKAHSSTPDSLYDTISKRYTNERTKQELSE